jgi:hypothetical protein
MVIDDSTEGRPRGPRAEAGLEWPPEPPVIVVTGPVSGAGGCHVLDPP